MVGLEPGFKEDLKVYNNFTTLIIQLDKGIFSVGTLLESLMTDTLTNIFYC